MRGAAARSAPARACLLLLGIAPGALARELRNGSGSRLPLPADLGEEHQERRRLAAFGGTSDVGIRLFSDRNCFELAEEYSMRQGSCYANRYTNISNAFAVKILQYTKPETIELKHYADDCLEGRLSLPTETFATGVCERFAGAFYAILSVRLRSDTCATCANLQECTGCTAAQCDADTCDLAQCTKEECSSLKLVVQRFFSSSSCEGSPYKVFRYPSEGECLRVDNGTQSFRVLGGGNISQTVYRGNRECQAEGADVSYFFSTVGRCYTLQDVLDLRGHSFDWVTEEIRGVVKSGGPRAAAAAALAWALALAALLSPA